LGTIFGVDTQLIRDGTYFIAEAEGQVVGCGGWSRRETLFGGDRGKSGLDELLDPHRDAARVRAFFVRPDWARRGIGSAILRRCEAAAMAEGFQRLEIVATLTGELLYLRFGYHVVERFEIELKNGCSLPVVRMTKPL
jgi:N-acetylglutamate synthase-like GNAT family acetyltransferase